MWKIPVYIIIVVWCIVSLPKAWKKYKTEKGTANFLEVMAKVILIPAGTILIIAECID